MKKILFFYILLTHFTFSALGDLARLPTTSIQMGTGSTIASLLKLSENVFTENPARIAIGNNSILQYSHQVPYSISTVNNLVPNVVVVLGNASIEVPLPDNVALGVHFNYSIISANATSADMKLSRFVSFSIVLTDLPELLLNILLILSLR